MLSKTQLPWVLVAAMLIANAMIEWTRFLLESNPTPLTSTVLALLGCAAVVWVLKNTGTGITPHEEEESSRDPDDVVRDALTRLSAKGWHVFHEVRNDAICVDHVVVGPTGIFTIDTQSRRELNGATHRIVVDRTGVSIGSEPLAPDALDRASEQCEWIATALKETSGKAFRVRPVMLFANCTIEQKAPRRASDPWVLGTKAFIKMAERGPNLLSEEQISVASYKIWCLANT